MGSIVCFFFDHWVCVLKKEREKPGWWWFKTKSAELLLDKENLKILKVWWKIKTWQFFHEEKEREKFLSMVHITLSTVRRVTLPLWFIALDRVGWEKKLGKIFILAVNYKKKRVISSPITSPNAKTDLNFWPGWLMLPSNFLSSFA